MSKVFSVGQSIFSPRKLVAASVLGLAMLQGCSGGNKVETNTVQSETITDQIPDTDGLFLSSVDQALIKAKLSKIASVKLWIGSDGEMVNNPYYEFKLKDGNKIYLIRPDDINEVKRLEEGLLTLASEPIYVTKGGVSVLAKQAGRLPTYLISLTSLGTLIFLYLYLKQLATGGKWKTEKPDTKFSDVRGYSYIVERLRKIVKYIKDSDKNQVDAKLPKGILLTGPSGTGKTLMARAIAGEADVPFIPVSGSDFIKMYAGLGAARIKSLFKKAKKLDKCIVFIDEIDAIGMKRTNSSGDVSREYTQAINELLNQMDGFVKNGNVTVIAATNQPELLDPALVRPGRFDLHIEVLPPITAQDRKDILDLYVNEKWENGQLSNEIDIDKLAGETVGFVGAELENLVERAAIIAFENERPLITMEDFNKAITEIRLGMERGHLVKESDRWVTAVHEVAGHGVIGLACDRKLETVSMIPRGKSLGHVRFKADDHSELIPSKNELLEDLLSLMGGRAAEMVLLEDGDFTVGADHDYKQARKILRLMLTTAMFPGHTSSDYSNPEMELSESDVKFVNEILEKALTNCQNILKQLPLDELKKLVEVSIESGELQGSEARGLFQVSLPSMNWGEARQIVRNFKQNPIGQSA